MGLILHSETLCDHHVPAEIAPSDTLCQLFYLRNVTLHLLLEMESHRKPHHWKLTIHGFASIAGSLAVCSLWLWPCRIYQCSPWLPSRGPAAIETSHAAFPVSSHFHDHSRLSSTAVKGFVTGISEDKVSSTSLAIESFHLDSVHSHIWVTVSQTGGIWQGLQYATEKGREEHLGLGFFQVNLHPYYPIHIGIDKLYFFQDHY